MPTYDFKCQGCGNNFTVSVSMAEKDNVTCPDCGSKEIKQRFNKINVAGIKGGGSCGSCSTKGNCTSCSCGGCS